MRNEDYIVIQGWMYQIPLTARQRVIYAIIWGFSRDGRSVFRGTANNLAEWAGCQRRQAMNIIRQLEDLGLVDHRVVSIPKKGRRPGGCMSEFWAILPEDATRPEMKDRIDWAGRGKVVQSVSKIAQPGSATDCTTPIRSTKNKYISGGGGKNKRASARKTTTTTGFLFENEFLNIPFGEDFFLDAWTDLLKQPKWAGKTPEALQIVLDRFALTNDPVLSAFCCIKAIERDWATIADPSKIGLEDQDQLLAYNDTIKARKEGAQL